MSTNASTLARYMPRLPDNIKYLPLGSGGRKPVKQECGKLSLVALLLALTAHSVIVCWLLTGKADLTQIETPQVPMLVSLLPSPQPEAVQVVPLLPKPEPVVHKQRPEPKVEKVIPQPQPLQHAVTEPVAQEQVPPTEAVTKVSEPVEKAPHVEEQPVPEAKPEPRPEPKIEPPRFGVAYLNNPPPAYPPISRRMGEQGRVILKVLVNANGEAETVDLETGSGSERLDQAAIDVVKKWHFIPAKRNNQPLSAYVLVPVKFSLQG